MNDHTASRGAKYEDDDDDDSTSQGSGGGNKGPANGGASGQFRCDHPKCGKTFTRKVGRATCITGDRLTVIGPLAAARCESYVVSPDKTNFQIPPPTTTARRVTAHSSASTCFTDMRSETFVEMMLLGQSADEQVWQIRRIPRRIAPTPCHSPRYPPSRLARPSDTLGSTLIHSQLDHPHSVT